MADVGIKVTIEGAEQAKQQLEGINKAIEDSGKTAEKFQGGFTKLFYETSEESAAKAKQFWSDYSGGANAAKEATEGLSTSATVLGGILGAGLAVGVGFLAEKLYDVVKSTADFGDQLSNLSQRTGVAVETLSGGLRLAAETSGSSIGGLATGLGHLNRSIAEAADGNGRAAEAFKRLGIDVHDAQGNLKSTETVLYEIANAFASTADGAGKVSAAKDLMRESGVALIPVLNQGAQGLAELEKFAKLAGIQMSGETAEAASKLNTNLRLLSAFGEGFWAGIATPIISGLVAITNAMKTAAEQGASAGGSLWEGWKRFLGESNIFGSGAQGELDLNKTRQQRAAAELENLRNMPSTGEMAGRRDALIATKEAELERLGLEAVRLTHLANVQSKWETTGPTAFLTGGGTLPQIPPPVNTPKGPRAARAGPAEKTPEEMMEPWVTEEIRQYGAMLKAGELSPQGYAERMDFLVEKYREYEGARLKAAAEATKAHNQLMEEEHKGIEARNRELEAQGKVRVDLDKQARAESRKAIEEDTRAEIRAINETTYMFKEQKLAALEEVRQKYEQMAAAGYDREVVGGLKMVNEEIAKVAGSHRVAGVVIQDVGFDMMAVWKGVHGALTNTISETTKWLLGLDSSIKSLGDALKSFATSVVNTMINEFSKLAANEIFRWLFGGGAPGGSGGGIGGMLSGALNWLTGGAAGTAQPGQSNFIGPLQQSMGGGGGIIGSIWDKITGGSSASSGSEGGGGGGGTGILGGLGAAASAIGKFFGIGGSSAAAAAGGAGSAAALFGDSAGGAMDMGVGLGDMWSFSSDASGGMSSVLGSQYWADGTSTLTTEAGGGGIFSGLFGGSGGGGGLFGPGGMFGGITGGIGGSIQDLGVMMGSQTIADIGTSIAEGGFGAVTPFLGGAFKMLTGDITGGLGSIAGGMLGNILLPGIGGAIGSFLGGLVGGKSKPASVLQGFDIQGALGPSGFQGTITAFDQLGNKWDGGTASWAQSYYQNVWASKLPGNMSNIPISGQVPKGTDSLAMIGGESTTAFDFAEGHKVFMSIIDKLAGGSGDVSYLSSPIEDTPEAPSELNARPRGMGTRDNDSFAAGGEGIFTSPTRIWVGDAGSPEHVSVTPLGGGRGGFGRSNVTVQMNGMSLLDAYSARRMYYELNRLVSG